MRLVVDSRFAHGRGQDGYSRCGALRARFGCHPVSRRAAPVARMALDALQRGSRVVRVGSEADGEQGQRGHQTGEDEKSAVWRATWQPRRITPRRLRALFELPVLRHVAPLAPAAAESATEDDEGSFLGSSVTLPRHLSGVHDFARSFATALHLPQALVDDLGLAGWVHDLGKADPRFQLLLHGGDPVREAAAPELLAKSPVPATDRAARERARQRSGYPSGMRHELLSVALVEGDANLRKQANDWDLVLHLVAAHHGWCRPFAPPVGDPEPQKVSVTVDQRTWTASTAHELQRFDSNVPERFWRLVDRYGFWSLAWLEAVLRLADHRESESDTPGAIYTGYQRGFLPVHEWLGFRGLRLFPLAARGSQVRMTACTGRRLRGELTWPLWESPAPLVAVRSLVGYPRPTQLTPEQRRALGISLLLSAELTKKADGYTGTFAPARPV